MNKNTFLITGGAGFIGTNLAEYLVGEGHTVIAVDDLSAGTDPSRLPTAVDFQQLDIRDTKALSALCEKVDVIVHLAAQPQVQFSIEHPAETHDINVNGTLSVLESAREVKVGRVVFASSSAVYGEQEQLPHALDMPTQPLSPYALHKLMSEEMLKLWSELYGVQAVSLRFFNVYGPHFDPAGAYAAVIGKFIDQAKSNETLTITGDGEQTRDFVHVRDVVEAIIQASTLESVGSGEVFNVGTGKQTSINELAKLISDEVEYVAARHELKHSVADISDTKNFLHWEPKVDFSTGITELKSTVGLS